MFFGFLKENSVFLDILKANGMFLPPPPNNFTLPGKKSAD
jgi:hypothetical protein